MEPAPPEAPLSHTVASIALTALLVFAQRSPGLLRLTLSLTLGIAAIHSVALTLWGWSFDARWGIVATVCALLLTHACLRLATLLTEGTPGAEILRRVRVPHAIVVLALSLAVTRCTDVRLLAPVVMFVGTLALIAVALVARARHPPSARERARAILLLAALVLGGLLALLDVAAALPATRGFGPGALATPLSLGLVTLIATRIRFRGREIAALSATYSMVVGACGIVALLGVYTCSRAWPHALIPGVALAVFAVVVAIRHGAIVSLTERQRIEGLATLGRFAAQVAHDLKNPLAAIKGAAQFLNEENLRKNVDDTGFVDLMLREVERMHRVIDNYQRLDRVEPMATICDVNDVVRAVMALRDFVSGGGITVRVEHHDTLAPVALDRNLFESALRSLVRNAFEAMPDGGTLTVRTMPNETSEAPGTVVVVEDTGVGMDATTRARSMGSFYTTKAQGSGLGLAYARRVVEAHGGDLALMSTPGAGTMVRIWLPRAENPPPPRES